MIQGLFTVRQYLDKQDNQENSIAEKINTIWREVNWAWHTKNGEENVLFWHWSPNYGWEKNHAIQGYDETLITHILAASPPTYSIRPDVYYEGWARNGQIEASVITYGYQLVLSHNGSETYGGPLFWPHCSFLGLDPGGLSDRYSDDYFEHN